MEGEREQREGTGMKISGDTSKRWIAKFSVILINISGLVC